MCVMILRVCVCFCVLRLMQFCHICGFLSKCRASSDINIKGLFYLLSATASSFTSPETIWASMFVTLSLEIIVQAEGTVTALETTLAQFLVLSWSCPKF